jgi:hypothetical protein
MDGSRASGGEDCVEGLAEPFQSGFHYARFSSNLLFFTFGSTRAFG